jgi:membrane-bound ClpP family serine protease
VDNASLMIYYAITIGVAIALIALLIAVRSRRHKLRFTPSNLIGASAMVDKALAPDGSVIVDGEVWLARSADGVFIPEKTNVTIVGVRSHFLLAK